MHTDEIKVRRGQVFICKEDPSVAVQVVHTRYDQMPISTLDEVEFRALWKKGIVNDARLVDIKRMQTKQFLELYEAVGGDMRAGLFNQHWSETAVRYLIGRRGKTYVHVLTKEKVAAAMFSGDHGEKHCYFIKAKDESATVYRCEQDYFETKYREVKS
jgi:hypothetical protein